MKTIPEIGDQIWHRPTGQSITVERRTRLNDGAIKLNGEFFLEDCSTNPPRPKSSTPAFQVGDVVRDYRTELEGLIIKADGRRYFIQNGSLLTSAPEHYLDFVARCPLGSFARIGDTIRHVSGHHAVVVKIEGNLAQIDGYSICGWVPVTDFLVVDAVEVENDDSDAPLDQHALLSLLAAVEAMIESGAFELDLLEVLPPEQKRQVWGALSKSQRDALVSAREGRAA